MNQATVDELVPRHLPDQSGRDGLSALALKRQLGVSYRTAWLVNHKIMCAMSECEDAHQLTNVVKMDDAYLAGELMYLCAERAAQCEPSACDHPSYQPRHEIRLGACAQMSPKRPLSVH
jgi:hypothetical protein